MGTIEHRGKNSWRIGERLPVSAGRQWVRRTLTYPPTMSESEQRHAAEIELARLMVDIADGRVTSDSPVTVRQIYAIWMHEHVRPNLKPTTATTYQALMLTHILPRIGEVPISELSPLMLSHMLNEIKSTPKHTSALPPQQRKRKADRDLPPADPAPLSDKTVRHCYDCLNYMLNKAVQWQLIRANPLDNVDRPRVRKRQARYLDDAAAVDLLRKLASEENLSYRCAVLLALLCGLRLGEVGALHLSDVDFAAGTIRISRALHYTAGAGNYIDDPKTDSADRIVTLPAGMMALLHEAREQQAENARLAGDRWRGDGLIVCAWDGSPLHYDTPSKWFRRFADANGFEGVTFHQLRHAHASILLANNMDAVSVAARLGHASPDTTYRFYAHALQRRDQQSADTMQALIERATHPDP